MAKPELTREADLGARGVRIVDAIVHDDLRLIFRSKDRVDLGIDGEIETVLPDAEGKRHGTGRIIAAQIKCGPKFFREEKADHYVFRGKAQHLEYWLDFSVPVVIIICDDQSGEAYWVEVKPSRVQRTGKGWRIQIPKANRLGQSRREIITVAKRSYLQRSIDLAAQVWFHAMNRDKVEFAGLFAIPRDFYGADHLVQVGDEQQQVHWIVARYGKFEFSDLSALIERYIPNRVYGEKLAVGLIAEHPSAFAFPREWGVLLALHPDVTTVQLLFNRHSCAIGALQADGEVVDEYYRGEVVYSQPWDSFLSWDPISLERD